MQDCILVVEKTVPGDCHSANALPKQLKTKVRLSVSSIFHPELRRPSIPMATSLPALPHTAGTATHPELLLPQTIVLDVER